MATPKPPQISFAFSIDQPVPDGYSSPTRLLGTKFEADVVPPGVDPVTYLRDRVLAELDRVTLQPISNTDPGRPTIRLPGFEASTVGF